MNNPLHYVLTYWKGDTLYTLDPGRGKEEPRQNFIDGTTTKWSFCNSGIFIEPAGYVNQKSFFTSGQKKKSYKAFAQSPGGVINFCYFVFHGETPIS